MSEEWGVGAVPRPHPSPLAPHASSTSCWASSALAAGTRQAFALASQQPPRAFSWSLTADDLPVIRTVPELLVAAELPATALPATATPGTRSATCRARV